MRKTVPYFCTKKPNTKVTIVFILHKYIMFPGWQAWYYIYKFLRKKYELLIVN